MQIDSADRNTPSAIRSELGRFAGLNPYGKANWRLVLAQDRRVRRGGIFKTMPVGDSEKTFELVPVQHKGKDAFECQYHEVKPLKTETGYRDVPKYPVKGWILERWFPASKYGSRQAWESEKSSDGITPMMGPYPSEGDYFMLAGPFDRMPDIGDLKEAIKMHIRMEEQTPAGYAQMMLEEVNREKEDYERKYQKALSDIAHFYESEVQSVMRGTSLAAGRIRNELALGLGDHSHQAVS